MRKLPGIKGDIKIVRRSDVEGDNNRGFTVDILELSVDDYKAGYLAMIYIPQDRFEQNYSNGYYDYLRIFDSRFSNLPKIPDASIEQVWNKEQFPPIQLPQPLNPNAPEEDFLKRINSRGKNKWQNFLDFNVCRPKPDYIRVYNDDDISEQIWNVDGNVRGRQKRNNCVDFTGMGLGHLLYREGARWMAEKNLYLHSSTLMEDSAVNAWKKIAEHIPHAVCLETRQSVVEQVLRDKSDIPLVLKGALIEPWAPDWANTAIIIDESGKELDILVQNAIKP